MGATRLPEAVQSGEALDVSLAPPGYAVAQPMLLRHDLAVELVLIALLFLEDLVPPALEIGKAALYPAGLAAIEPDRAARQIRQKPAGVGDHHDCRASALQLAPPPFGRG